MNPLVLEYQGGTWKTEAVRSFQDIRQVAAPGSIGGAIVAALPVAVSNLPVLPQVAQHVMGLVQDPETSMAKLAEAISQDQVIAVKILQLANSALYGGLNEIKDLNGACARLGMKKVAAAVQAAANGRLYQTRDLRNREPMEALWRHGIASAHCAYELGVMLAKPNPEVLFVAGLVHDIGKVLLIDLIATATEEGSDIFAGLQRSPELFAEVLTNYHTFTGLHIIQHWGLAPEFTIAAFCHGQFETIPDEAWLPMLHIVSLSSAIARASGFGLGNGEDLSILSHPSTKYLGLGDLKIATLRVELEDRVEPLLDLAAN